MLWTSFRKWTSTLSHLSTSQSPYPKSIKTSALANHAAIFPGISRSTRSHGAGNPSHGHIPASLCKSYEYRASRSSTGKRCIYSRILLAQQPLTHSLTPSRAPVNVKSVSLNCKNFHSGHDSRLYTPFISYRAIHPSIHPAISTETAQSESLRTNAPISFLSSAHLICA